MNYEDTYLKNNYEIDDDFTFTLENIDEYKNNKIFSKSFSIITAFNPNNELLRCIQNQDRNMTLKKEIQALGYDFTYARGYLDGHSEDGFLIYNISFEDSIALALKHEQYAIFYFDNKSKKIGYYKCEDKSIIIEKSI